MKLLLCHSVAGATMPFLLSLGHAAQAVQWRGEKEMPHTTTLTLINTTSATTHRELHYRGVSPRSVVGVSTWDSLLLLLLLIFFSHCLFPTLVNYSIVVRVIKDARCPSDLQLVPLFISFYVICMSDIIRRGGPALFFLIGS